MKKKVFSTAIVQFLCIAIFTLASLACAQSQYVTQIGATGVLGSVVGQGVSTNNNQAGNTDSNSPGN